MPSYIPDICFGSIRNADGHWTGETGLVSFPAHMRPRKPEPLPDVDLKTLFNESPAIPRLVEADGVFFLSLSPNDRAGIAYTVERLINMLDAMEPDPDLEPYLAGLHQGSHTDDREGDDGYGGDADNEPSLGWTSTGHLGKEQPAMFGPDLEADDSDDEPILGARERHPSSWENQWGRSGVLHHQPGDGSQEHWSAGATSAAFDDCEDVSEDEGAQDDREHSLGWQDEGAQDILRGHFGDGDLEADLAATEEIDQVRRLEVSKGWQVQDSEPDLGWAESAGKGIVGPQNCLDDRENDDEREDTAEHGIADDDALHSEEFMFGGWTGNGSGGAVARNILRKISGKPPLVEKATKLPDETIVRRIAPRDDDVMMIPELDLRAHFFAAHGVRPC